MGKVLTLDVEECTGCKMCELACSFQHYEEFNPIKSYIRVYNFHEKAYSVPVVCFQCEDAWCENICPSTAITISEDREKGIKIVQVNEDKCAGCRMCVLACPFGNIVLTQNGTAGKCDLCGGDPECVKYCYRKAIRFVEEEDSVKAKSKSIADQVVSAYQK